jgi:two-component system LytT family response regulator
VLFSKTLKEFEELLENSGFERIHHSHIINLNHLVNFINKDGGYVVMSDKSTLPVSQRKKTNLINALNNLA